MAATLTQSAQPFDFRLKLFKISRRISDVNEGVETMKFFFKDVIPRQRYLSITYCWELFAELEASKVISVGNTEKLRVPFESCHQVYDDFIASGSCISAADTFEADFNFDHHIKCPVDIQEKYNVCLLSVANGLAVGDGSLPQLVYLCPEIPLGDITKFENGREVFETLQRQGLISQSSLSYLYRRLCVIGRLDLAQVITDYVRSMCEVMTKERRQSLTRVNSDPGPTTHESCNGVVPQHSLPSNGITAPRQRDEGPIASEVKQEDGESKAQKGLKQRNKKKIIEPAQPNNKPETKATSLQLRKQNAVDVPTELDETINIFDHKAYTIISYCLDYFNPLLVFLIILIFIVTSYKFYLEEATCGFPTASLNFVSRMLTHVVLPSYFLHHLSVLDNEPLKKLRFLRLAGKTGYRPVVQKVILSLSTLSEKKELQGKVLVEQINCTLNKKLSLVMGTSTLLSVVFFLHILFLGAANFKTFSASSISLSNVCISVITLAAFIVHCTTGTIFCFYLFEMRVREYCSQILRLAGKRKDNLRADVKAVKSAILARWGNFRWVMFAASSVYLSLLLVSVFTATPFHCHGEKVEFTKLEWNQIRASWTFHVILGFVCHVAVYNYFNFVRGRYIAMMLQVFYFILGFFDPHGPKWAIMIQITNVIYPISSLLSFHILACHNIWNREKHNRRKMNTITVLSEALKSMIFFVHFVFVLLHFVAVAIAIYNEYQTLKYRKVS